MGTSAITPGGDKKRQTPNQSHFGHVAKFENLQFLTVQKVVHALHAHLAMILNHFHCRSSLSLHATCWPQALSLRNSRNGWPWKHQSSQATGSLPNRSLKFVRSQTVDKSGPYLVAIPAPKTVRNCPAIKPNAQEFRPSRRKISPKPEKLDFYVTKTNIGPGIGDFFRVMNPQTRKGRPSLGRLGSRSAPRQLPWRVEA